MTNDPHETVLSDYARGLRRQVGMRIVEMRQACSLSQTELAERLGISRARLGKWEGGHHAPSLEGLVALSRILEVTTDEILRGKKPLLGRAVRADMVERLEELLARIKTSI